MVQYRLPFQHRDMTPTLDPGPPLAEGLGARHFLPAHHLHRRNTRMIKILVCGRGKCKLTVCVTITSCMSGMLFLLRSTCLESFSMTCRSIAEQIVYRHKCSVNMTTKRRPSRIVYKYVEVPHETPVKEPKLQPPKESLASRAWANCYQPPSVHFDLPSPESTASASSASSTPSSRSASTSSSHSSASSASSHGCTTTKLPPPVPKTRTYSSPAILTKSTTKPRNRETSHAVTPPPLARSSSRPVETSYTTTTTTITTNDGTFVKEHKVVSGHGFHDAKGAADWSGFRSPDWEYPLHKKVKEKKVLASYPHYQVR